MKTLDVIKKNMLGQETWRYPAQVLKETQTSVLVEAFFNRESFDFHGIWLGKGDRFVEAYYTDRWFNIFEIRDKDTDSIKGWYCNVTYPAVIQDGQLEYIDLALDLLVYPDDRHLLLDEDEFADLSLSPEDASNAWQAVDELKSLFALRGNRPLEEWF